MLSYSDVLAIRTELNARFTYVGDFKKYKMQEHWPSFDEIPDGPFTGDCDDFAQAMRKELLKRGEKSRLCAVGVDSPTELNHLVCIYNDYIIDNIQTWPMLRTELPSYTPISMSGEDANDPWHEVINDENRDRYEDEEED